MSVAERLASVRARIDAACARSGRDPASVELLAVSKGRSAAEVRAARAAGQPIFGENRAQELAAKAAELADADVAWHFVGSLQTNKAADLLAVPRLVLLHSLDRARLAERLQALLDAADRSLDALLQVNASGEASKHGVAPAAAEALAARVLDSCPRLRLVGVMAMGPRAGDPAPAFAAAAAVRARLRQRMGLELPVLSLGMTDDLEAAVAAGSTLVRIGTGVFGPR